MPFEYKINTLVSLVQAGSRKADEELPPRNLHSVLAHLASEVGELAEEVNINAGFSTKVPGKDGIIGEAVDVIQCALDAIHVADPTITEAQLMAIVQEKINKWLTNYKVS